MVPEKSNVNLKDEILKGPEYFYCEKLQCRLKIEICLQRQQANLKRGKFKPMPFPNCLKCSQGAENLRFKKNGGNMPQDPSRGNGQRNIGCEKYNICLDVAAKKDWKTFNCEKCPLFTANQKQTEKPVKKENTRICKRCDERTTIHSNSPYCSQCLHAMKTAKRKAADAAKKKNEGSNNATPAKAKKTHDTAVKAEVYIDFGKYIHVLTEIEKLAEKEMRPVGLQIAWILQKHLENIGGQ